MTVQAKRGALVKRRHFVDSVREQEAAVIRRDLRFVLRENAYVALILKGAKPSELPVERPSKFQVVINLKTAKALGITVPPALLITAKESVESCYLGTGRMLYGRNFHVEGLALECQIGNPEFHGWCILGTLLSIADMRTDKAFEFCKVVPEKFKTLCYDQLGGFISILDISKEEKEKECLMAENLDYSKACTMRALGEPFL